MSILVLKSGLLDTIQDNGRYGYSHWGINPGGSMDRYAAQLANLLVGNAPGDAVLEMHFPGPQLLFEQTALISICGADFMPMLDDQPLPNWQPFVVRRNTALYFDKKISGSRVYLALHGGIDVPPWLGSCSTHLKAAAGGFEGRKLEKLDRLFQGESRLYFPAWLDSEKAFTPLHWRAAIHNVYSHPNEIFFTPGPEWNQLTAESQDDFQSGNYLIHPSSDRMGYLLKGQPLIGECPGELLSSGVNFGCIQLLPSGQLVVLMADHQTTGGYPRIGQVIAAHLPKLAQLGPSDPIHFTPVSLEKAESLYLQQQKELRITERACFERLKQLVC